MSYLLVFGDSVAWGAWDEKGGWAQRLKEFADDNDVEEDFYDVMVYNVSISGNTSEDLVRRFEFEAKQRMDKKGGVTVVFAIGTNDAGFLKSKKGCWVPKKKFESNLHRLISTARKFPAKIVFVGLFPADEARTRPVPWCLDLSYLNSNLKEYDEIIKRVCKEERVGFIEMFDKIKKGDYRKLQADGIHPNAKGHQKIFETVKEALVKNRII